MRKRLANESKRHAQQMLRFLVSAVTPSLFGETSLKANPFSANLGQRIAERRKAAGITQVQLAEALGIAQQTMAHYESGVSAFRSTCSRTSPISSASASKT